MWIALFWRAMNGTVLYADIIFVKNITAVLDFNQNIIFNLTKIYVNWYVCTKISFTIVKFFDLFMLKWSYGTLDYLFLYCNGVRLSLWMVNGTFKGSLMKKQSMIMLKEQWMIKDDYEIISY